LASSNFLIHYLGVIYDSLFGFWCSGVWLIYLFVIGLV
jgi:hypothetical protein